MNRKTRREVEDWVLPSSVTLFFDELALFALIWIMKRVEGGRW